MQANTDGGAQTIELPAGVYTLTIANDDPAHDSAVRDLDITGDLTLRGVGPGATIVQAGPQQGRGIDRVFEIHRSANVRIENLSVRYGRAEDAGAIRVWGTLTLVGNLVTANESAAGGGGITNNGTLVLIDSAVTGNRARYGGGIVNFSRLTLRGSAVNSNSAVTDGGGIAASGEFTAVNSTISNNRAGGTAAASTSAVSRIMGVCSTSRWRRTLPMTMAMAVATAAGSPTATTDR
jgi:predicted outer membrane repeat protein